MEIAVSCGIVGSSGMESRRLVVAMRWVVDAETSKREVGVSRGPNATIFPKNEGWTINGEHVLLVML